MQWWNDFLIWFYSDEGSRVVSTAIVPFIAIILGAVIAAFVSRGIVGRLLAREDRDDRAAAVGGFIEVARQSTQWANLTASNQDHLETLSSAASVRLRLLPTHGAASAAEWAEHQIGKIKGNSASFSVQSEQDYIELRDRLAEWQHKPRAARRLFAIDLAQFQLETTAGADDELVERQQQWAAEAAAAEQAAADQAAAEQAEREIAEREAERETARVAAERDAADRAAVAATIAATAPTTTAFAEPEPEPDAEPAAAHPVFAAPAAEAEPVVDERPATAEPVVTEHIVTSPEPEVEDAEPVTGETPAAASTVHPAFAETQPYTPGFGLDEPDSATDGDEVVEATIEEDPASVDGDAPPLIRPRLNDV